MFRQWGMKQITMRADLALLVGVPQTTPPNFCYQYSTCDPVRNAIATLPNLVNHQNVTAYLDLWKPQIAAAKSRGKEFVVGEFSSVSCSGKENVTDTFGQALWLADTILYGGFLNISRMYLHQGATLVFQSSDQANR
ncbi:hypothetical protein PHLCEN_2v9046 [Hermanssonia centrifuga]|uniref:Uncharacterized protein n=1 Tax=Hermanssonia centrifuga TaxID=98765 RepID=A0A2R6NRT7_9APHY|nr:hypothetical protein PHLCEN_2v9046 [Hermanssonia centrifuga]